MKGSWDHGFPDSGAGGLSGGATDHEGERIYFGAEDPNFWSHGSANEIVAMYSPGVKCLVFVDPDQPTETVLRRGDMTEAGKMLMMSVGTGILTIIFVGAIYF